MAINQALLPMMNLGWGRIINIGMAGINEIKAYRDVAAHAAAKTALAVLTKSWALELKKDNITVNMVSPGIIDFPARDEKWRRKMKRIAGSGELTSPNEVARAVRFLAERGDVTGRIVEVDPGFIDSSL
jgi:3-oxoacyl-[acyl-carrier protein] reductase